MEVGTAVVSDRFAPRSHLGSQGSRVYGWVQWRYADFFVALAATFIIVLLHVWFTPNVGGLWRDEVNTVNLATLPTWADLWRFQHQDSFPLLFASTVRIWSGLFGSTDDSLRLLGLLIGLCGIGAIWINARLMGLRFPFWSLVLVGANPMIIRYGDSMRGNGLGIVLLLLMFGCVWKVIEEGSKRWVAIAALVAVLAVQATYYNAVLLFAISIGGSFVTLRESNWRATFALITVGAAAAISLLPYAPTFLHSSEWNFLVHYAFDLPWMWKRLSDVIGAPLPAGILLWSALVITSLVFATLVVIFPGASRNSTHRKRVIFCGIALLVGLITYYAFLKLLSYRTQPWYYLSILTFAAVCIDAILQTEKWRWPGPLRATIAGLFLAFTVAPTARMVALPHTNLDVVARELGNQIAPEDLILLTHWGCGVTWHRYYSGRASWMTIPPLDDFRFQAYQPVLAHMREKAPLLPIFVRAEQTLKAGGRVWFVGSTPVAPPGVDLPSLPRVGDGPAGWRGSSAFYTMWIMQVTGFLRQHSIGASVAALPDLPLSPYETLPVLFVQGWKD